MKKVIETAWVVEKDMSEGRGYWTPTSIYLTRKSAKQHLQYYAGFAVKSFRIRKWVSVGLIKETLYGIHQRGAK